MLKVLVEIKSVKGVPANILVVKKYEEQNWKTFSNDEDEALDCMAELIYEDVVDMYDLYNEDEVVISKLVEIK